MDRLTIENIINDRTRLSKFLIYSNLALPVDLSQLRLINEFKCLDKVKPDFYSFGNTSIWAVDIKCARPHHAWPDQNVFMFLEELIKQESSFRQTNFLKLIEAEMFKIEMEKDLKNEAISKLNKIKKTLQEVATEI